MKPDRAVTPDIDADTPERRFRLMGQLATGLSHDLANLLTSVLGNADLILARADLDDSVREDMSQLRQDAERGVSLVRRLLALGESSARHAPFDHGGAAAPPPSLCLNTAVADMGDVLQRVLPAAIDLRMDIPHRHLSASVDPSHLDRVLMNLAINARDAMPTGGNLTIRLGPRRAVATDPGRGESQCRWITLTVEDTGEGMTPEIRDRIFEPYFTTRRDQGGSGIGLSTVQDLVTAAGGFVTVESDPGQGTRVEVHLPEGHHDCCEHRNAGQSPACSPTRAVPPSSSASVLPPALLSPSVKQDTGHVVLLVEDEGAVRRVMERALQRRGFRIVTAASGEAALTLADELDAPIAAMVSDVVLPGMDGITLIRAMRTRCPGLPAIMVSGYVDAALRSTLERERITFLAKPYALARLVEAVTDTIAAGSIRAVRREPLLPSKMPETSPVRTEDEYLSVL